MITAVEKIRQRWKCQKCWLVAVLNKVEASESFADNLIQNLQEWGNPKEGVWLVKETETSVPGAEWVRPRAQ